MARVIWQKKGAGKVRDLYESTDGKLIALVATDRISADDEVLGSEVPGKGQALTMISARWFEFFEREKTALTAFITAGAAQELPVEYQDERFGDNWVTIMRRALPLKIEAIIRGYLTGSSWSKYEDGKRKICGIPLGEGIVECGKIPPEPIFTPTNKAAPGEHDKDVAFDEMVAILEQQLREAGVNLRPAELALLIQDWTEDLYEDGNEYANKRGIIIADTKFEFGLIDRELVLIDEVLTPDSSRFWMKETYEPGHPQASLLDKEPVRKWVHERKKAGEDYRVLPPDIVQGVAEGYRQCYELLWG